MVSLRRERGTTLVETAIVVAIVAIVAAGVAAGYAARKPFALRAAVDEVGSLVDDARALAQTSGSGATIVFSSDGHGGFSATAYPFRPLPGADLSLPPARSIRGGIGMSPLPNAIFISSSGTASAAAWSPATGPLAAEPACTGIIALTFDDGFRTETHTVSCAHAALQ